MCRREKYIYSYDGMTVLGMIWDALWKRDCEAWVVVAPFITIPLLLTQHFLFPAASWLRWFVDLTG